MLQCWSFCSIYLLIFFSSFNISNSANMCVDSRIILEFSTICQDARLLCSASRTVGKLWYRTLQSMYKQYSYMGLSPWSIVLRVHRPPRENERVFPAITSIIDPLSIKPFRDVATDILQCMSHQIRTYTYSYDRNT